jgi:hypothetical protein
MDATTAAKIAVALDDDLVGGPADETVRSGIGGTDYEIELSGHTDPASIVQQYQAATAGRWRRTDALADANQSPGASQGCAVGKAHARK